MPTSVKEYTAHLRRQEKSPATIEKYARYAAAFLQFARENAAQSDSPEGITRESVVAFKEHIARTYTAAGANGMIAAVNGFLAFLGKPEWRVKPLRVQRAHFCAKERTISRAELDKLVAQAQRRGKGRLALVMQTLFATGIRVGELRYITLEAVEKAANGSGIEIRFKGKTRTILLPGKLCALLLGYAAERGIQSGPLFVTRGGKPLDRSNIWNEMKKLCRAAKVAARKVFPHNLRKLFARTYYERRANLVELAGLMGHSDINTTRLYTATPLSECLRHLDALRLVS